MWVTAITIQRGQQEDHHIFSQLIARQRLLLTDDSEEIQKIHSIISPVSILVIVTTQSLHQLTHLHSSSLRISLLS
jgi:hypothetical protein